MNKNPNCCGGHCREATGEVRVYPLGAGGNLILCHACWTHENHYRYERQADYVRAAQREPSHGADRNALREQAMQQAADSWPQVAWNTAEVYGSQS